MSEVESLQGVDWTKANVGGRMKPSELTPQLRHLALVFLET